MPTIVQTTLGKVTGLWGSAVLLMGNGKVVALKIGDLVHKGDVVLTTQDGIVQLTDAEGAAVEVIADTKPRQTPDGAGGDIDRVIAELNTGNGDSAPAAGLVGGDGAGLTPGYRVDRIAEGVGANNYGQGAAAVRTELSQYVAAQTASSGSTSGSTPTPPQDPATTVTLTPSSPSVSEGGSIVITATVGTPVTGSPLVIGLSNGQTIVIPVGQTSGTSAPYEPRVDDAQVQGPQTVDVSIVVHTGGNYQSVTPTGPASIQTTDDADTTTVTLTASAPTVAEGGSLVYTATVDNPVAGSPLVVTLSNGATITIPVGQSSGSVTWTAPDDAHIQGTRTQTVSISGANGGSYEDLDTTRTVATSLTDDADQTTITLSASTPSVAEGGSVVYTATVNGVVQGSPLVITLTNGQTITIPVGASSASSPAFAVRADDAYAQGTETLNVGVAVTSGGDFEALTGTSVSTQVTDDSDSTAVTLSASSGSVAEGGSIVYTATLSNPVGGSTPMTITLSNGQTITIPVGASSGSSNPFIVRGDDAYSQADDTHTVSIDATSGGNFEDVTRGPAVTTTVTDDGDATTVTLTASASTVAEGGSITYTASVNNAVTGSPLVITLDNGQTITIPVGASSGSSNAVAVRVDDAYVQPNGTVTASINGTSGGNYESLNTSSTATTTVVDDSDSTTVTLSASATSVAEGGSIVYTATVNNAVTGSPLVVTLSNGETITIPVGASSANSNPVAVRADDAYVQADDTVTASISGTTGGNFEHVATGPAASTTVTDDGDATTVTLSASSANVTEGGSITYTVTLSNAVTGSPLVITLSNSQTITIPVGASSGTSAPFAVRGDDAYSQADDTHTVSVAGTSGGNFEGLVPTGPVTTIVTDDNDGTVVTLTASSASVAEGGSITYTASVNNAVTGTPLVITLNNGETITIPVGASSASSNAVPVRADDAYLQGNGTVAASISGTTGGNYESLTTTSTASTTVTDDADATTVTLSASSANVTEGGSIVYTATLSNPVGGSTPMTITLSNGQTITIPVGASSGSSNPFIVRADDAYSQADDTHTVSIDGTSGGNFEAVTRGPAVTTIVTDDADASVVTLTASATTIAEGGSITYTATVSNAVTGSPLVITLNNGQTITIPVGASSASSNAVAVRADDAYVQPSGTVTASISGTTGGNYESLTTTSTASTTVVDDSDATTVTLTASSANVTEGGSIVYTATLSNAVTGSPFVITLSNGQTITIPVGASSGSGPAYLVRGDDAYAQADDTHTVSIDTTTGGNFEDVTHGPAVSTVVTDDGDISTVTLSASATSVNEGGSIVYTATVSNAVTGTPLVVTLSNGQTITIPVGQSSGSSAAWTVRADDAYTQGDETVSASISNLSGGNYEDLARGPAVSTTVIDDGDATTVTLTASSANVTEGGSIVYTATLSNAVTGSPLVITLSNLQTITIPVGQSSGTSAPFAVRADDAQAQGDQTLTVTVGGTSGGNFESVTATGSASTVVSDNATGSAVTLSASASTVTEGGSIVYTATVDHPVAGSPLSITLSNGQIITIPVGQSSADSAPYDVREDDVFVQGTQTLPVSIVTTSGGSYESLATTSNVSVDVVDDSDIVTVSLTASPVVDEGGMIIYAAVLTALADSPVSVTLSNGQTITIPAGAAWGYVLVPAGSEDGYLDSTSVSAHIVGATGGNFENLQFNPAPSSTVIDDTIDDTTLSITGSASVAEGASASYTLSLTRPAQTAVTVTLNYSGTAADGSDFTGVTTVTIPAGASSAGFSIATLDDALAEGAENFVVTIGGANGGNFENLVVSATHGSVTTGIVDNDIATVSLSATGSLTEAGGNIVYTATITQAPTTALTVTLSNGATISIAAGALTGTVSVPVAADDDVYRDPSTVSANIASTSGGGIPLAIDPAPATTNIVDTLDDTTVTLSASAASVAEGGAVIYTATVDHAVTGSALVLNLSNGQTITIPVGQTSASSAPSVLRADDAYTQGTQTVTVGVNSHSGGNFESVVATSTTSITVTDDVDTSTVTLSASTASVAEGGSITYTATVNQPVTGSDLVITLSNNQTITIPVGQSSASSVPFAVRGDDAYAQGTQTINVTIDSTSGGNYEDLATAGTATTTVTDDADATTVTLSASSANVTEGGSIVYTATLSNPVGGSTPMIITLSNGQTITIPVGASSGSSTPFAVRADDAYHQANDTHTVSIDGTSGGNFEDVTRGPAVTTIVTDDADASVVTLTASATTIAEGGSITYTATVSNPVTGSALVITLNNGETITIPVGASSASSNAVAVRADDAYVQPNGTVTASISGTTGGNYESLTTTSTVSTTVVDDNDATTITLTASSANVAEGGSIVYTATLSNAVTGSPLVITLSNSQTITIPVGQSSGSSAAYAVRADDAYVQADDTLTVSVSGTTGGNFESLSPTGSATTLVHDDADASVVTLTASATTVAEGGSITYTATVSNAVTGSPLVITLNNGEQITIPVGQSSGTSAAVPVRADDAYTQGNATVTASINGTTGGNFESLTTSSTATTTVTDDGDATTVTLSASATTVAEGGSIVYTATVNNVVTGSALVVALSNGATITIPVGASSASSAAVAVRADDVYVQGAQTVTASIDSTSGGNFEAVAPGPAVSTTVTDDADATTVTLSASASTVAEGGSITYTATVNNAVTGTPLVITLNNGQVITIPVGASSASSNAVAVRADDAYAQGNQTVTASINGTSGGNFESLTTTSTASTVVTDDGDVSTITLSASSASVTEGGSIVYTATVSSAVTGSALVITLNNGETITIPVGQTSGSSNAVAVRADDVYAQGNQTVTASINGTSGGNFESLNTSSTASTTVTDDADVTTVTLTASSASVAEGGSIVYTATVNNAVTGTPLVITLNNGEVITIPVGQSSASSAAVAVRGDDVYVQGNATVTASINGTTGGNFESLNTGSTASTTVTDDADSTTVTLSASATSVTEGGSITYTATVSNPVTGSALVVTLSNGETITIPVGASSASSNAVAVRADDAYVQGNTTVTASISGTTGGNFEHVATGPAVSTTVTDDGDATIVTLTASASSVNEGGSIVYTATVNNAVTGTPLVITLNNGQQITIPVGSSSGTSAAVAVRGDDAYVQGNGTVTASINGTTGGNFESLTTTSTATTTVTDDGDSTLVTLTASAGSVAEGGSITYTATVSNPVTGSALVVTLSNGEIITIPVGASSASSNAVAVRADDAYVQGNATVTVSIDGTTGGNYEAVARGPAVSTTVTDDADATTVTLTASSANVTEGGSITYTATLSNAVTGSPLTITLSNGQTISIPVGQSSGTSAAWTVRADDAYVQGNQVLNVTVGTTSGGNFEAVTPTGPATTTVVDDADSTVVTLTPSSTTIVEGGSITYTATVSTAVTGTPLVITLNNGQQITIPVGSSSGTSAAVPVRADDVYVQGNGTVTASITGTTGGNYESLTTSSTASTTVTDDGDATTVTLSASSASVAEGGSITYTATVNNPVTGSALVVTLSNGETITIPVGQSSASSAAVPVRADDVYVQGNQTVTASISTTSGGNFEAITRGPAVSTTVTDDSDATTVTLTPSSTTVTEGGSITYTATLSNAVTGSPLTINLSNGQTITIPVGQSSGTSAAWAVRGDDAYVQGTQAVNVTVGTTSGGNFELVTPTGTATTTVTDDADSTVVTLTASSASVAEGGSITYTATVNNAVTGTPLVITLNNGQVITIPVGASSASSNAVAVRADDAYAQGNQTVTASISNTSGGNFEALTTSSTASTTVTDDSDASTITLTASSASVVEGGSIVYTATVSNAVTGSPLVITLSNSQTITIPVGQTSGTSAAWAVRADDVYTQGTQVLTVGINGTTGGNYESLTTGSTASTTVTDDSDATTVTLTASAASVVEGGSIVYTATVNNAVTGSPLVVTLSNGEIITIPVGQSSASSNAVAVRADDAYVQGNQTVTASISTTSGGNFEAVTRGPAVSTTVTDDSDATTVTLTASSSTVTEGGSITYTATLNNAVTGSPLTINLSNGQTITIPVGQSSGTSAAFAVRGDDAYVQGTQTLNVTVGSTSGGNFEAVTPTGTATTTVTDDSDATVVTLTPSSTTIAEGGSITYTATVNNAVTGTPLVITLNNGQVITIPVGQSSASSNAVAVRADDAYVQGNTTVTASISGTSGGNYESLTTSSTASTTVTDDGDATTVTLTASSASVAEGGSIVYTATVNNAVTGSPLVVTLSNGETITIPVGSSSASSAAVPVRADDAYAQGNQTVTASISNTSGGNFEAITRGPAVSTTVTDDGDATVVTLTASATNVTEGGSITYTATVSNPVTGSALVITLNNGQSITIPVGASSASSNAVAVRADDAYAQGNQTVTASINGTSGGNYESLTTTSTASTTVTDDADPTTVTLSVSSPTVVEGGSVTYTATLSNAVTGSPLTINLSNGQTITIPVGSSSGTTSGYVVRADDAYAQGSQAVAVGVSSTSGGNYEALTTTSTASTTVSDDSDTTTVSLSGATSVTEGGNAVYTLTLSSPAATAVTVTLTYGGTAANGTDYTAVTTVTIPAGASSANFTVPTINDTINEANETIAISIGGVSGGGFEAIAAHPSNNTVTTTITDNDPLPTIAINDVVVNEAAGTATFTVTLSAASGQQVTVGYGTSNGTATAGSDYTATSGTLTFGPGVTSQTITVSILNDGTYEGAENFNVNLSTPTNATIADNLGVGTIRDDGTGAGGTDNDTPTLAVSSPTVAEGGGYAVFTVSLSNAASSATTVSLATVAGTATAGTDYSTSLQVSTDGGANWTNATSATFAAGATSVLVRSAITNDTLDELNESFTLTATTTAGATTNSSASGVATITDDDPTPTLAINDVSVNEGAGTMTFTVTLSTASGQQVTVNYGTSNGTATAGSDYTAASGTLTFAPGVTSQTITVSILNDTTTESTETFNVNLSGATNATIADNLGVGSIVDNDARPVIDLDANNSSAGGVDYTATFTENGSPVSIADTDISITDVDSTALAGATITLTNAQAGDVLAAGTMPSGITASLVGNVITLSGSASLAAYQTAIRAITFSNTSDTPSTADRIITVTVNDGSNASATATTYMHVVAVNDAPVATGGSVTGTEDTALVLSWSTFGVTDVDSASTSLGIRIATLPADGTLQTWNGSAWTNVSTGQTISKATIDSGFFRLVPDANESGSDAYAGTAVGNRQSDYARFNFTPTDGSADGAVATVRIDITPVTDAPTLTHNASTQVTGTLSSMTSIGLSRDYYQDVPTLTSGASSSAPNTGEIGIETAVPTSSSAITNVGVAGTNVGDGGVQVAEDDAYRIQGLIYLEAGKSYVFSGYADDTSRLEIGGNTLMSGQWGGSGQASNGTFTATTFTPTATGYYSLEFMVYNTSGPGSYDLNVSVNGAAAVDVSTANFYLYQSITQVDNAGAQRGAFVANTATGEGGYYPVTYDAGVQSKVYLAPIVVNLTDTDGSETLAVQLQNIAVGATISDGTRSFTATAGTTSVVVTNWDLSRLSVTMPTGFSGTTNITAVATATETATGTTAATTLDIPLTIDLDGALAKQSEANTYNADALIGLAGNDTFTVTETGSGLSVAVSQGASGSIQALTGTETTATTSQVFSTGAGNDMVQSGAGDDTIYLGDSGNSNHPGTGAAPTSADIAGTRLMTLADGSLLDSSGLLTNIADNTSTSYNNNINNTAINTWADVANAGSGNDVVYGQGGTDLIYGGSGNDYLNGGAGNDGLRGGAGNDILVGGAGNDVLRGDAGADVFRWEFGDKGTAGAPAADIIMDFDTATPSNGGDVLDLRDLLQGEAAGNLGNYLHFSVSGGSTVIQISSTGAFSTGFANNKIDQTITLQNVDLTNSGSLTTDQQIINDLMNKSKLLVDGNG